MGPRMEKVSVNKNRLFFWAVIIAILNPIFSGLILGLLMYSEPELKSEGRTVTLFSLLWSVLALLLAAKFRHLLVL